MKDALKIEAISILVHGRSIDADKFHMLRGKSFTDEDILDLIAFALVRRKNSYCCFCKAEEAKNG